MAEPSPPPTLPIAPSPMATPRKRQSPAPVRVIKAAEQTAEQTAPIIAQTPQPDPSDLEDDPFADLSYETIRADGKSGRVGSGPSRVVLEWSESVKTAADRIGFILPTSAPRERKARRRTVDGVTTVLPALPWRLAAAPNDLDRLSQPVELPRAGGSSSRQAMLRLAHGMEGKVPSMAAGEGLPLLRVLQFLAVPNVAAIRAERKLQSWGCLQNEKQANITLLGAMAEATGRYCYLNGEMMYLTDSLTD